MLRLPTMVWLYGIAVAVRALAALLPDVHVADGDWPAYATVAHNMLSGCGVSLSPPDSGVCVPHFGGNGLPGYPTFIAIVWSLTDTSGGTPVIWAQLLVSALAVPRLAYGVARMSGTRAGLLCGLLAALSPLQSFMVTYRLAEALTLGATNWLLAELALSFAARRLRVLAVTLPLLLALFLRLDSVLLTIPVGLVALRIHGFRRGLIRGAMVALLLALPLAAWTARNFSVGVPLLPASRAWMLPDGSTGPLGYLAWLKQWVTNEDQRSALAFFKNNDYAAIHLLPGAFLPADQAARAQSLLDALKAHDGQPFPSDIDAEFATLATELRQSRTAAQTAELRLIQAATVWRSWIELLPKELRPGDEPLSPTLLADWVGRSLFGGLGALFNTLTRFYRFGLGLLFLVSVATLPWQTYPRATFTLAAVAVVVLKSILSASGLFIEARYNVTAVPFIELTVMLMLAEWLSRRHPAVVRAAVQA